MERIKKLFNNWRKERERIRELNKQLEALTDHFFFIRADYHEDRLTVREIMEYKFKGIL